MNSPSDTFASSPSALRRVQRDNSQLAPAAEPARRASGSIPEDVDFIEFQGTIHIDHATGAGSGTWTDEVPSADIFCSGTW